MNITIVAGGTGGHFYPGLAIAKKCQEAGDSVHFIVRRNDFVIPLLQREGFTYSSIFGAGLVRGYSLRNIFTFIKISIGIIQSGLGFLIRRPSVLLVMGGYLSFPAAIAAKILFIPIVLHEQNVMPGLANRMISGLVDKVALSFSDAVYKLNRPNETTGNPIRASFAKLPLQSDVLEEWGLDDDKATLLAFGGSLGAHKINQLMMHLIKSIPPEKRNFQVVHFTGDKDQVSVKTLYEKFGLTYHLAPFCHSMEKAYAAADVIISRAGASTISELIIAKKPTILIPYPFATDNHQLFNANILAQRGAAEIFEERNLNEKKFTETVLSYLTNPEKRKLMTKSYENLPHKPLEAATKIRDLLLRVSALKN